MQNTLWQSSPRPRVLEKLEWCPELDITFETAFTGMDDWKVDPEGPLRIFDWQRRPSCPEGLKTLANRYRSPWICGFTSIDESSNVGLQWHTDTYELFVVNTEGTTKWHFWDFDGEWSPRKDPKKNSKWGNWPDKKSSCVETIIVEPLMSMYVPMWIPHTVEVLSDYRTTFSLVRFPSDMDNIMKENSLPRKTEPAFDEISWPLY